MGLALNYARMPGPGDLGFPDDESAFDRDDAINLVVDKLVKDDDAAELVMNVANARALLVWIGREVVLPAQLRADWVALDRQAKALDSLIESELGILNAPNEEPCDGELA